MDDLAPSGGSRIEYFGDPAPLEEEPDPVDLPAPPGEWLW